MFAILRRQNSSLMRNRMAACFRKSYTTDFIPIDVFNAALLPLWKDSNNWKQIYHYNNMDAWIDHGEVHLQSVSDPNIILKFRWTNWFEGEITGPQEMVDEMLVKAKNVVANDNISDSKRN